MRIKDSAVLQNQELFKSKLIIKQVSGLVVELESKNKTLNNRVKALEEALGELVDKAGDECGGFNDVPTECLHNAFKALKAVV